MILVWVDAGPAFGLGHVSRGLALAEALRSRGVGCTFALPADPSALAWLGAAGLPRPFLLPERGPVLPDVLAAAEGTEAVVVDVRHPLTQTEVRALATGGRSVLVVDNPGPGAAAADLVLAPLAPARATDRWLVGPAYMPLRRAHGQETDRMDAPGAPPLVLVSMGGSDPGGLTIPVVEALAPLKGRAHRVAVRVLANPASAVWPRLPGLLGRLDLAPASPVDPERMPEHLRAADVAVLAMGVTVYEAMAAGLPAVVLCRTSGDAAHARMLGARGAIVSLGQHWTPERITEAVGALVAAPERRAAIGRVGRAVVDGRGAERVAARLCDLLHAGNRVHADGRLEA